MKEGFPEQSGNPSIFYLVVQILYVDVFLALGENGTCCQGQISLLSGITSGGDGNRNLSTYDDTAAVSAGGHLKGLNQEVTGHKVRHYYTIEFATVRAVVSF